MLPFEEPDNHGEEEEIDPFKELEIGTAVKTQAGSNPLAAFEEDDPLAAFEESDPLSAFEDSTDDVSEEVVISFDDEVVPEIKSESNSSGDKAESTYKLLLETVWVDDILDPSEVELLSRKRKELGLSFVRHLQLVREIIEG